MKNYNQVYVKIVLMQQKFIARHLEQRLLDHL